MQACAQYYQRMLKTLITYVKRGYLFGKRGLLLYLYSVIKKTNSHEKEIYFNHKAHRNQ